MNRYIGHRHWVLLIDTVLQYMCRCCDYYMMGYAYYMLWYTYVSSHFIPQDIGSYRHCLDICTLFLSVLPELAANDQLMRFWRSVAKNDVSKCYCVTGCSALPTHWKVTKSPCYTKPHPYALHCPMLSNLYVTDCYTWKYYWSQSLMSGFVCSWVIHIHFIPQTLPNFRLACDSTKVHTC